VGTARHNAEVLIVLAPDKFKGSLSASQAASAMERGARRAVPAASTKRVPLADGGEGTVDALLASCRGVLETVPVAGPLGEPVSAALARLGDGRVALEMASASGLALVDPARRDALRASSRGTGELIRAALEGVERDKSVVVGIGGSASTDGGTGAASALGWRFLDRRGHRLPDGGGSLRRLARIDPRGAGRLRDRAAISGASDVGNPLLGPSGAARTFAPQKGASPAEVEILEEGLAVLAERIGADLGMDVAGRWGAGACGGMGAGLIAFFDASLGTGFDVVAQAVGLAGVLSSATAVVTGEGRLDAQSLSGKTPMGVARVARTFNLPCFVVAGEVALSGEQCAGAGFAGVASLVDEVGRDRALGEPVTALAAATEALLRRHPVV
jgi:glycerate 2-kinase